MKIYNISTTNANIKVTEEDISDILSSAFYGGIGYWASLDKTDAEFATDESYEEICTKILVGGGYVKLIDICLEDDPITYWFNLNELLCGIQLWIELGMDKYGAVNGNELDCGNIDSECADCIIQLTLFDDVVYG